MLALSIRQPSAWHILHSGQDVENRYWRSHVRGRVLIHAPRGIALVDWESAQDPLFLHGGPRITLPPMSEIPTGGIVGSVEIVDCVSRSDSPWFKGKHAFVLRNPIAIPLVRWSGAPRFFEVPDDAVPLAALGLRSARQTEGATA